MTRLKYDYNMLKSICDEGGVTLLEDYKDKFITRDTRIIGKCISCENSFDKSLNKLYKQKNFGCKKCAKIFKFDRIKCTMVEKYGVKYAAQSETFKNKMSNSCLEKYGVKHALQSEEVKNKIKETNLEKYGVEYVMQNNLVKDKSKQTNLEKYGVENPLQRNEIKEKIKNTNLQKYGVEHSHQDPEIAEKAFKNSHKLKTFILPSGKEIKCQGYEPFALNELIKDINENDILTGCKNVPTIWYNDENGKKHRHYVDIFIPSQNKCVEIKSTWTAKKQGNNIFLKQNAGKELGYNYEIWVYDGKGNKIELYT